MRPHQPRMVAIALDGRVSSDQNCQRGGEGGLEIYLGFCSRSANAVQQILNRNMDHANNEAVLSGSHEVRS